MQRIRKALTGCLWLLVVLLSLILIGISMIPRLVGYTPCGIHEDGAALYPKGTLVLARAIEWEDIRVGDVLVFKDPDSGACFTRCAVQLLQQEHQIVTASSMDDAADPMTTAYRCVVGKVGRSVPVLGYPAIWFHTFWGKAVIALLYIIWISVQIELYRTAKRRETAT